MKKIQVYGTGCAKCLYLYERAKKAADQLGIEAEIEKVTDIMQIMQAGVMSTPALGVDGEIKVAGRLPEMDEVKELIS